MSEHFIPLKAAETAWHGELSLSQLKDNATLFVDGNQLIERWQALSYDKPGHFVIAEIGFGCGLNFLLTWFLWKQYAPAAARLHFLSATNQPVSRDDLVRCASLWPELQTYLSELVADYPILTPGFHHLHFDNNRVSLTLLLGEPLSCYQDLLVCGDFELENKLRTRHVDAWFLNQFIPANLTSTIGLLSKKSTTLTANFTDDDVERALQEVGFRITGRINSNLFNASFDQPVPVKGARYTPWHVDEPKEASSRHAIILGAGLAGCYSADALARRGWLVTLIDEHNKPGCGASGNRQAVVYPLLSAFRSPLSEFMLSSFLFATRAYKKLLKKGSFGEFSGILQLENQQNLGLNQDYLASWLKNYPELALFVDKQQASDIAGIALQAGGVFVPTSGWVDAQALCQILIEHPKIRWVPNTCVETLSYGDNTWRVGKHAAEVLILATAYKANQFEQTMHLPLNPVRGQMTMISSNLISSNLKIPLCGDAHILPARGGMHTIGATYQPSSDDNQYYPDDNVSNLAKLKQLSPAPWSSEVVDQWTGIRAATPDYLPLLGAVADADSFKQQFAELATDSRRWVASPGTYHPGLYVCAGFGSRGLTSIPLSAEWLAANINNEPGILPRKLVQAISPARFLRQNIIRGKK